MARRRNDDSSERSPLVAPGTRVPPHSLEAERAVLGGILLENNAMSLVTERVQTFDFYSQANAAIFDAMITLYGQSKPIDQLTLREQLAHVAKLALVGGDEYLLSLTDTLPTVENIGAHAAIVREKAIVRRLISACHEVAATGYGDYGEFEKFLDQAEKSVFDAAKDRAKSPYSALSEVIHSTFQRILETSKRGVPITGLPTGYKVLDDMTSGMHPGDLIIIAGRPAMGKTAFALNVATNAAASRHLDGEQLCPVAIFSLEMPKEQLAQRMLASEARVDSNRLRQGRLTKSDWQNLASAAGKLNDLPIYIDDTAVSLLEIRAKARRIKSEHGLALLVIDYLQLMRSGSKSDSREQEISEISRSLKGLAKDLGIPIIALSQLNRAVETRAGKDKRPQLSDLRESGAIEQDADTIWFVYREEVYNKDTDQAGLAEIIVGKQRAGSTGVCTLRFVRELTRFENYEAFPPSGEYADG